MVSIQEKTVKDKLVTRLKDLGLSSYEASIYLALLTRVNASAGELCKETAIPDSKIYYALDGLEKKGALLIKRGNPNIYHPLPPKEAIANLKQQLSDKLSEQLKEADALVNLLTPLYDAAQESEDLELVYLIRGQNNIINRIRALVDSAKKELTLFIPYRGIVDAIQPSLLAAEKRHVKLQIAMTKEIIDAHTELRILQPRLLRGPIGMLIFDQKTILTISNWTNGLAMLTQDPSLVSACREYYNNPSCCIQIR
jgi:sugar-specific transcriptional regulator TrmB